MKGYIYKYTFPDGKVYIGQTVRPVAARHREHTTPSTGKVNVGFWEAWERFGKADLEVIETVEESDSFALTERLNALEITLIERYHATDPRFGYNRVPGGLGTSSSKKVLMRAFRKVFDELWMERRLFYAELDNQVWQIAHSPIILDEEQASFLREAVLPNIESEYRPYISLSIDGRLSLLKGTDEQGEFYEEEAFSWLLFVIQDLSEIEASELAREVESYVISNASGFLSEGIIQKVAKDGTVVKEYRSITEIMHELNLSYNTNIYNVLEGKQKTAYGYIWRWKNKESIN